MTQGPADEGRRPTEAEIRRALAECMTVADIDDALGWSPGTARRRRWRAPDRGGLPFADAELGGVTLWFRSTLEAWQSARPRGRRVRSRPERPAADDRDQDPGVPGPAWSPAAPMDPGPSEESEPADAVPSVEPAVHVTVPSDERALEAVADPTDGPANGLSDGLSDGPADGPADSVVRTGFALEIGQRVLAELHGRWREARVRHRDRGTVVVDYSVDQTPLGARRQRINIDRVRVLPGG